MLLTKFHIHIFLTHKINYDSINNLMQKKQECRKYHCETSTKRKNNSKLKSFEDCLPLPSTDKLDLHALGNAHSCHIMNNLHY